MWDPPGIYTGLPLPEPYERFARRPRWPKKYVRMLRNLLLTSLKCYMLSKSGIMLDHVVELQRTLTERVSAQLAQDFLDDLCYSSPRKMWSTLLMFTKIPADTCVCTPDQQWGHWSSQGDISEDCWSDGLCSDVATWC